MLTNRYRKIWIFLCLILYSRAGIGQECSHLSFSIKNGLAGDNIYAIIQDNDGFLWVSTETGVSRFDGTEFKNYTIKDGLPNNDVNAFLVDQKNRIWMSPFKKEICYYYNGSIHNRTNDPLVRQIPISSEQKAMATDAAGNMLIETDNDIAIIDRNNNCHHIPKPYRGKRFFRPVYLNGIISAEITDTPASRHSFKYYNRYIYPCMYPLGKKQFFISADKHIILFSDNKYSRIFSSVQDISSAIPYNDSSVIIATRYGAYIYNVNSGKKATTLLQGYAVNLCYRDNESGIWIGTNGAGLFYIPSVKNTSITHTTDNNALQVCHFYTGRKNIIAGTSNRQFWQLGRENNTLDRKLSPGEITISMLFPPEGNMLKNIESSVMPVLLNRKAIPDFNIACKSVTTNGDTIQTAIVGGTLYRFLPSGRMLARASWNGRLTCGMYVDGNYYAGTLEGLYLFPGTTGTYSPANAAQLVAGTIYAMAYGRRNRTLWVITADNGVYCLQQNRVIKHFDASNGLSDNICKCVFTDGENAYIGTINGLNIIRPGDNFSIVRYYTTDGLVSNNINSIYAAHHKVWAGTSEGLSCLDISEQPAAAFCRVNITEIAVSGKSIPPCTTAMTLSPEDNNIRLAWSGICFRSIGQMKYTYRLRGLDDSWQSTGQHYLAYPSLPSGTYSFDIYATNRYNTRSSIRTIVFTIAKHWWEHWWVWALGFLLLFGLFALLLWRRILKKQQYDREKIALKEKIIELEQLALRAQMNPHFIFNSLNSFYQYVINQDLSGASKFMSDFSKLIRLLFETTSLTQISLAKETEFLTTYLELEKTKLNGIFTYSFTMQADLPGEDIIIPSFVIQPFIENSIRHGIQNKPDNAGRIDIHVFTEAGNIVVNIDDNGAGREYTAALKKKLIAIRNSKGIKLTEERIALYNKTHHTEIRFSITDKYDHCTAVGTLVTIYFPLKDIL